MSEFCDHITDKQAAFIARQPVFFVATAAEGTRINLSPKGMDTFRVLAPGRRPGQPRRAGASAWRSTATRRTAGGYQMGRSQQLGTVS